ncbi:hypothetical protein B0H15DRAFT_20994 [Mycena belliarum]|uniref:Uncharacterized protein n=1 Tax=Mycena belliarum TaxID=1033014 RepID=A0AAD6UKT1_9AGAR|nr:hypothetical protein B0H15DRAFT_20994 [Mycena belliae]
MAGNPSTVVLFGSGPEAYYVGHGRRHFIDGMSPSFTNHATTALNISMSLWISVSRDGETWIDYNAATEQFHHNSGLHQDIRDHLSGANGNFAAQFVSFPDTREHTYFVKGKDTGAWNAVLPNDFIQRLTEKQAAMPNFDAGVTGMLFGQGTTNIILFTTGFDAVFDESYIKEADHPLYKVLVEFGTEPWCIERGSQLCFYDSRYFFLKFSKPGEQTVHTRWNLPLVMAEKLAKLREEAQVPEERLLLMQQDQAWMDVARTRRMGQMQTASMVNAMALRNSLNFALPRTVNVRVIESIHY